MNTPLQPTTRAQVSGHKFLRRRVEHGLAFGDIRMIHDPLRARSRAMIFGAVAVVLGMLGAGLFAWLNPQADPGDAPILRSSSGALFVRIDDQIHPVSNLASARLAAASPAEPVSVGADFLAAADKGAPVGINPAPGYFAASEGGASGLWAVCTRVGGSITVVAGAVPANLGEGEAVLATGPSSEWVLTENGRRELPDPLSPEGRVLRRGLGITPVTPRLEVPAAVLTAIKERPAWSTPEPLPAVLVAGEQRWALSGDSVAELSPVQAQILTGLGAPESHVSSDEPSTYADARPITLPESALTFVDPVGRRVCGLSDGHVGSDHQPLLPGAVELAGDGPASTFAGLSDGAVAVDSGHGLHVISPEGIQHPVEPEGLAALGITGAQTVPWSIISTLPEGPRLTTEDARRAVY